MYFTIQLNKICPFSITAQFEMVWLHNCNKGYRIFIYYHLMLTKATGERLLEWVTVAHGQSSKVKCELSEIKTTWH